VRQGAQGASLLLSQCKLTQDKLKPVLTSLRLAGRLASASYKQGADCSSQ